MRPEHWEERAALLEPYSGSGKTHREIAAETGFSATTVRTYEAKYGFKFGRQRISKKTGGGFQDTAAAIAECAEQGLTRQEAAESLGLTYATIHRYAAKLSLEFKRPGTGPADAERSAAMVAMFQAGKTLAEIGELYGVSRERVRQILNKYHGITADDGGQHFKAKVKNAQLRARQDAKYLEKYGYTFAEMRAVRRQNRAMMDSGIGYSRTPLGAFQSQRQNAKSRDIEWSLSFRAWWEIWQASGKWADRGRGRGYMMCRFADQGAYEVGNVYIATGVHNGSVQPNNPYRKDHPDFDRAIADKNARRAECSRAAA